MGDNSNHRDRAASDLGETQPDAPSSISNIVLGGSASEPQLSKVSSRDKISNQPKRSNRSRTDKSPRAEASDGNLEGTKNPPQHPFPPIASSSILDDPDYNFLEE